MSYTVNGVISQSSKAIPDIVYEDSWGAIGLNTDIVNSPFSVGIGGDLISGSPNSILICGGVGKGLSLCTKGQAIISPNADTLNIIGETKETVHLHSDYIKMYGTTQNPQAQVIPGAYVLEIPACAGAPTGTTQDYNGTAYREGSMVYDSTNNRLYLYKDVTWSEVLSANPTLSSVLTAGNTSGANNIIMSSDGTAIDFNAAANYRVLLGNGLTVNATASTETVLIGRSATAGANSVGSVIIGRNTSSAANNCVVEGNGSSVATTCTSGVAIGNGAVITGASSTNSIRIGTGGTMSVASGVGIGNASVVSAGNGVAISTNASCSAANAISIGVNSVSNGAAAGEGVSIGASTSSGTSAVAVGANAAAQGGSGIAVGKSSNCPSNATRGICIGQSANITNTVGFTDNIRIGTATVGSCGGVSSIAIGVNNTMNADSSVLISDQGSCTGSSSVAIGPGVVVSGATSVAVGSGASASGSSCVSLGLGASNGGFNTTVALGALTTNTFASSIMLGAAATHTNGVISAPDLRLWNHLVAARNASPPTLTSNTLDAGLTVTTTALASNSSDTAGTITLTTIAGSDSTLGMTILVTFGKTYGADGKPLVLLTPYGGDMGAGGRLYVLSVTATTMSIRYIPGTNNNISIDYLVVGTRTGLGV